MKNQIRDIVPELNKIQKWETLELRFSGKCEGNSFLDYEIHGSFFSKNEQHYITGFYDGDGEYVVRFMPSFTGRYTYRIDGSYSDAIREGSFEVVEAEGNNRGPVKVTDQFHFTYSDGTPYYPIGTTCYAFAHQKDSLQRETLSSLKKQPFNKIRFCVFPKHYDYNLSDPELFPYEGTPCDISGMNRENYLDYGPENPENCWDFTRFVPAYFIILENRIKDLMDLGIEADLILFHPYDRWGFSKMGREADQHFLRYVLARFSAYRNVWWSLANEYDLCAHKTAEDWEAAANLICKEDPYKRLRSIHNCHKIYDFTRPWVTHCSIQRTEIYESAARTKMWREQFGKPVVLDEVGYEGTINYSWGNLTGEEMVRLFWTATVRGGYCGHGETFAASDNRLWWSHGGTLYGESGERIAFLYREILMKLPGLGLKPGNRRKWEDNCAVLEHWGFEGSYYLFYTGNSRPSFREFSMEEGRSYRVEVIDTWNMTVEDRGVYAGRFDIPLPSRPYMAIRMQAINSK